MKDNFVLDLNTVERVEALARLSLSERERDDMLRDMRDMLEFASAIAEVDTEGVPPMEHILRLRNVFREDECRNDHERDELIAAAPDVCEGYVRVPAVIKEQVG